MQPNVKNWNEAMVFSFLNSLIYELKNGSGMKYEHMVNLADKIGFSAKSMYVRDLLTFLKTCFGDDLHVRNGFYTIVTEKETSINDVMELFKLHIEDVSNKSKEWVQANKNKKTNKTLEKVEDPIGFGDTVYIMYNDKIRKGIVTGLKANGKNLKEITYTVHLDKPMSTQDDNFDYEGSSELFKDPNDLVRYLLKNIL